MLQMVIIILIEILLSDSLFLIFSFLICPFKISKSYVVTTILSIYFSGMRIIVIVAVDTIY